MIKRLNAVIRLTGLGLASANAVTLSTPHGESVRLQVSLASDDGTVQDPGGGTFTFRMTHPVGGRVIFRDKTLGTVGQRETLLDLAIPASIPAGSYQWDLWFTPAAGSLHQVIPLGSFLLLPSSG